MPFTGEIVVDDGMLFPLKEPSCPLLQAKQVCYERGRPA
nr:hypothetical protein Iba_chr11bCG10980 [Ipomoea batatas]GMD54124.1 hypothetical protein Iba_chr11cCG9150 [Ipomoea batatas]